MPERAEMLPQHPGGGHNAKTEWLQWSDSFVHSTFAQVQDNESYRLNIEKVSHEITEIVKACLESNAEGPVYAPVDVVDLALQFS